MKILVTGAAGFIGSHLSNSLLNRGNTVFGIDNLNDYYDVSLKKSRLENLIKNDLFTFLEIDIANKKAIDDIFKNYKFDKVVNLAAQAGVRYSIKNPHAYIESNILGFMNILEGCRHNEVKHLVYASSSSVYGANETMPFSVHDNVDHPLSLYAATKKSNELMAHTYSHLYELPTSGLRFFTVYGPWGRPDMALFMFTKAILEDKPIDVFNHGNMMRDFTYVDDIVNGIERVLDRNAESNKHWSGKNPDPGTSRAPWKIYNIGNSDPIKLMDFIKAIEVSTGKKAIINKMPMQPGDVPATYADILTLKEDVGYEPSTSINEGVAIFVKWYREYFKI
ncbi:NAD-dependent epimerase [Gammaproteobacteria bacterium]|nr:NAD-dependent epimerase [Gammaproteobacteria bacterium]